MYLTEFPDIQWIRRNAAQGFSEGKDYRGNTLPDRGWPNVVLKVDSSHTERDHIKGPFSLFYNLQGKSLIGLDNQWYGVSDQFYCLSNQDQAFNLHIPKEQSTVTSNIHFGQSLFNEVAQSLSRSSDWMLDNQAMDSRAMFECLPKTEWMSTQLMGKLHELHSYRTHVGTDYSLDREYELLGEVLESVLLANHQKLQRQQHIQSQKASTRNELFQRISIAIDYIHSNDLSHLDLDSIAQNCGLSKFHLIRVFKEIYQQIPAQYIAYLKLQKAQFLMNHTGQPLSAIALTLGFSELSAFTRFYKRMTGQAPSSSLESN